MKIPRLRTLALLSAGIASAQPLTAALNTDPSQLVAGATTITFEAFPLGIVSEPFIVGAASFSSSAPIAITDVSSFGVVGSAVASKLLLGSPDLSASSYTSIRIDFLSPVGQVAFGWWDPNFSGSEVRVYDSSNALLEVASIPTGPANGTFATFRGIQRDSNDISYAVAHISSPNDVYGIDNVSYGAVPEPTSISMGIAGALLLCARRRSRLQLNTRNG
jgi:hypothetical protein